MKKKLIPILLLGSTFLLANSIVGAWTMDKAKAELLQNNSQDEMEKFLIGMMATSMTDIEFREDGSCQIGTKNRTKCWKKSSAKSYLIYEEDGSNKGAKVELKDENSIELTINKPTLLFTFNRTGTNSVVTPKIVMQKERLYHAKNMTMKDFHLKGSAYFLFTGENKYFHLSTEKLNLLSLKELKEIKAKSERHEGGFLLKKGAYQVNNGEYKIKENAFYTSTDPFSEEFNEKKIEIVDETHLKFNGCDYYLEENKHE